MTRFPNGNKYESKYNNNSIRVKHVYNTLSMVNQVFYTLYTYKIRKGYNMIELKINLGVFYLELHMGSKAKLSSLSSWFKLPKKADEGVPPKFDKPTSIREVENSFDEEEYFDDIPKTHISEIAEKYAKQLETESNIAFPPSTPLESAINDIGADVHSSTASDSDFFNPKVVKSGIYSLEEDDHLLDEFSDLPDVEIITDDYELQLEEVAKKVNNRYLAFKESHGID